MLSRELLVGRRGDERPHTTFEVCTSDIALCVPKYILYLYEFLVQPSQQSRSHILRNRWASIPHFIHLAERRFPLPLMSPRFFTTSSFFGLHIHLNTYCSLIVICDHYEGCHHHACRYAHVCKLRCSFFFQHHSQLPSPKEVRSRAQA